MLTFAIRPVALTFLALLACPSAAGAAWRWPLNRDARVVAHFKFSRSDPYRAGALRGVVISRRASSVVRAVCSGVVSYSGPVPQRRRAVTINCGRFVATELGLASTSVARGDRLLAGQPLGALAAGAPLQVGARIAAQRQGYVDPLALFAEPQSPAPLAPFAPRGREAPPGPQPVARQSKEGSSINQWLLAAAWLGLGISSSAIGAGIALRGRGARRSARFGASSRLRRQH